jgi:hypothetical protein
MSRLVEQSLQDFNVVVEVTAVLPGPVITRFEMQPAAGVKVSRISGEPAMSLPKNRLSGDFALINLDDSSPFLKQTISRS